jgi:hypothetical protein
MSEASVLIKDAAPSEELANIEERKEITHLARRLPRHNAVRQIAFGLLEGRSVDGETRKPLVSALLTPDETRWRERAVAAWAVGQIPLNGPERLEMAGLLGRIVTNRQLGPSDRLVMRAVLRTVLSGLTALLLYSLFDFSHWGIGVLFPGMVNSGIDLFISIIMILFFVGILILSLTMPFSSFFVDACCNNSVRCHAARSLGRLKDPLSIGVLATAAMFFSDSIGYVSMRELRRILPLLTPEQYGQHDRETVPALCKLLIAHHVHPAIVPSIVEALGKIGDGRAVKPVEKIAKSAAGTPLGEAAERVLPILRERQQRENDPLRLVRAASAPSDFTNHLLRPAQDSGSSEARLLLRSSVPDEEER